MKFWKKFVKRFLSNTDLATDNNFHSSTERQMPGCHEEPGDTLQRKYL